MKLLRGAFTPTSLRLGIAFSVGWMGGVVATTVDPVWAKALVAIAAAFAFFVVSVISDMIVDP